MPKSTTSKSPKQVEQPIERNERIKQWALRRVGSQGTYYRLPPDERPELIFINGQPMVSPEADARWVRMMEAKAAEAGERWLRKMQAKAKARARTAAE